MKEQPVPMQRLKITHANCCTLLMREPSHCGNSILPVFMTTLIRTITSGTLVMVMLLQDPSMYMTMLFKIYTMMKQF